jgi:hypothetical protein
LIGAALAGAAIWIITLIRRGREKEDSPPSIPPLP